ncbi:MAG: NAD-dependent epimerase/dehydratase family protein [Oscillospiraceae bacterium]|nr:NAD-dependent epimerase/dehydratase family protein [Oscillospiraceae bacterium]
MKILVTGANGFVGRNLVTNLKFRTDYEVFSYDIDSTEDQLRKWAEECDFVIHLAGVNRPKTESEFAKGNRDFTQHLLEVLEAKPVPIAMTSSIQAALDNPYGVSKLDAENLVFSFSEKNHVPVYIWRMPNIFGKWCRPNYNSAVATFCYNIARDEEVFISDPNRMMNLIYIDDVVNLLLGSIRGEVVRNEDGFCVPLPTYNITLGDIVSTLREFHSCKDTLIVNDLTGIRKCLYSTYLSYLPENAFSYKLTQHADHRGAFSEFFKNAGIGQFSVSTTVPGITRGNHWHNTKVEKFLVVAGEADLCFRKLGTDKVIRYHVTADEPEIVDIPVGYTHNIINTSQTETLVTLIWANEIFDPENPDTYYEEV